MNGQSCHPLFSLALCDDRFWTSDRKPISFLLGAAAQFGIFGAYFLAILMGFNDKQQQPFLSSVVQMVLLPFSLQENLDSPVLWVRSL